MGNKRILYLFCELHKVFAFTNRVMLTVSLSDSGIVVVDRGIPIGGSGVEGSPLSLRKPTVLDATGYIMIIQDN